MSRGPSDSADIVVFPPVLLGGGMILAAILDRAFPFPLLAPLAARLLGLALFALCLALGLWAHAAMRRAGTNIRPDRPTLAIATDGPFRFTRNPLYLAGLGVYLAVALFIDGLVPLLLVVPIAIILHRGVVLREEHYLEGKFGETYLAYRSRVRRWV
ncbi:MAG: isoprenylcysteine carboxylmethyltransferase family protein [Acidobacteria bacterium]|nr:isoprenylcysteine carboxylmethyltransferase family protein [Acidobacteriota bacterium]